ncbi:GNAT family N-acetyltransferase [Mesobacillus selenatarsenatis]|uniref:Acetyltransferase, GNAT family n=1 Tax=Mesobacillus selenatarsenatis (strain DSM 18680 / JCM 14380 / FERM P-15431 / SF-1) TaxID=1321606 RepID=A0A0A8WWZ5_MESS1|nr:GNAT family N-acetyltransferase [Mesobacillus selenatarsenatis]GAM12143.1 acetyltransferase, GNAT family [Mesobacillus selenatarsenatis SF-1]
MLHANIRRPTTEHREQLNDFFRTVIIDTFNKEGIGDQLNDINEEIEVKKRYLTSDFESNGLERYFLIALYGDKIIGSIEFGPANEIIRNASDHAFEALVEVGTVFVHPDHQRNGVGNLLLKAMYETLRNQGIEEFCLDSGYKRAQLIWKKKFGEPDILLKDYWGENFDHMIWKVEIREQE